MALARSLGAEWSTKKFCIEYGGYLSNHLSHGIVALHKLGASQARVDRFVAQYIPHLEASVPEPSASVSSFDAALLGKRQHFYSLVGFYEGEVAKRGLATTLQVS